MKTAKWKVIPFALSFVLMFSIFTACSSGGKGGNAAAPSTKEGTANVSKDPVDITFYRPNTGTTGDQFMDLMGTAVKAKFPYVNVKFIPFGEGTKIEDVLTTGLDLDIIMLSIGFIAQFPKYNLDYDLSEQIKKNNFDLNRLEPTTINFVKNIGNGKVNSLPIFTTAAVLNYNKDLFDKFGVPYPKDGMTWDETYELAKKLTRTDGGVQYYGLLASMSHMFRVNQLSLPFVDPKTNKPAIVSDDFRKFVDNFARFYRVPGGELPKEKQGKEADMFSKDRTLAMYAYFNSTLVGTAATMNVDAVSFPTFKDSKAGSQMYPTFSAISNTSKHKDVAFQILSYLTSDEMQMKFAKDGTGLPVVKNQKIIEAFGESMPQLKGKNIKSFYPDKPAAIPPTSVYDDLVAKRVTSAFNEVVLGSDVISAFRKADEQANIDIESAKAAK